MSNIFHPLVWLFDKFKSLFNSMSKEFNNLEPSVQAAIKDATGIVQIISDNVDKAPDEIIGIINGLYPGYTLDKLQAALSEALHDADLVEGILDPSLTKTISNLTNYLSGLTGLSWAVEVKNIRDLLAIAFDPEETTWQKIALFGEWVFIHFFKKD